MRRRQAVGLYGGPGSTVARLQPLGEQNGSSQSHEKKFAREWAPKNGRVNTEVPGHFPTEQNRKVLIPGYGASIMGHTPMRRIGEAREFTGATHLLANDSVGRTIRFFLAVDGGPKRSLNMLFPRWKASDSANQHDIT